MMKIIKTKIENDEEKFEYQSKLIKNNNVFLYKEDDFNVKLIVNDDNILLNRKNKNFESLFDFNNKKSTLKYTLLENNLSFDIEINTLSIEKQKDYLKIEYLVEDKKFVYEIWFKEDL